MTEEYLTPKQVAAILKISLPTVYARFSSEPGVINLGSKEHRLLRIPRKVLEKYLYRAAMK